jgi:hypothetical protein
LKPINLSELVINADKAKSWDYKDTIEIKVSEVLTLARALREVYEALENISVYDERIEGCNVDEVLASLRAKVDFGGGE